MRHHDKLEVAVKKIHYKKNISDNSNLPDTCLVKRYGAKLNSDAEISLNIIFFSTGNLMQYREMAFYFHYTG